MITINTVLIRILVHERYEWWYTSSNVLRTLLVFGIDSGLLQLQLQRLHSELSSTELTCLCSKWLLRANPRGCKTSSPKCSQSSSRASKWLFREFKLTWLPSKRKVSLHHALDWQLMTTHLTRSSSVLGKFMQSFLIRIYAASVGDWNAKQPK